MSFSYDVSVMILLSHLKLTINHISYTINVIFKLSCLGQLNNHGIITETSYPKPTIRSDTYYL